MSFFEKSKVRVVVGDGGISMLLRAIILDIYDRISNPCNKFSNIELADQESEYYLTTIDKLSAEYGHRLAELELLKFQIESSQIIYEELNKSHPKMVEAVHRLYLEAGSQLMTTNSFGVGRIMFMSPDESAEVQQVYDQIRDLSFRSARIAGKVARRRVPVFGSVGAGFMMTKEMLSISDNFTDDVRLKVLCAQIRGLIEGGVDFLLFETICSIAEFDLIVRALHALENSRAECISGDDCVAMPSCIFTAVVRVDTGCLIGDGASMSSFVLRCDEVESMVGVGINCIPLVDGVQSLLVDMRKLLKDKLVVFNPNMINSCSEQCLNTNEYDLNEAKDELLHKIIHENMVDIIGGCCGSGPRFVAKLKYMAGKY